MDEVEFHLIGLNYFLCVRSNLKLICLRL